MFRKLIRLWVMTKINYSENYVITAMQSGNTDIKNVTHNQIAAYKAILKQIEADLMIDAANCKNKTVLSDVDMSVFKKCETIY